jgi:subtilisin family serine protease
MSGTSMATPMATGACALLLQADPSPSPQQVKGVLMRTAKNLNLNPNTQGAGRGDVLAAFDRAALDISGVTLTPTNLAIGQLLNVRIAVRNGGATSLPTQEPGSGFVYDEGDTFVTWGFADVGGNFRVGIDFDNRVGLDHPYRWGIGDAAGGRARRALSRERFD